MPFRLRRSRARIHVFVIALLIAMVALVGGSRFAHAADVTGTITPGGSVAPMSVKRARERVDLLRLVQADVSQWAQGSNSSRRTGGGPYGRRSPQGRMRRMTSAYQSAVLADSPVGFW